jgi:hypothetical protein
VFPAAEKPDPGHLLERLVRVETEIVIEIGLFTYAGVEWKEYNVPSAR